MHRGTAATDKAPASAMGLAGPSKPWWTKPVQPGSFKGFVCNFIVAF